MSLNRVVATGNILVGACLLLWGSYIPAKAALAQFLLNRAWEATSAENENVKPWPWADTWPIARLHIVNKTFVVLADGGGESLAFGPSHVAGSVMPGELGVTVISAHRDTQFSNLPELAPGDVISLEVRDGGVQKYLMREAHVLPEPELTYIPDVRRRELILVTCWPVDSLLSAPQARYAVVFDELF